MGELILATIIVTPQPLNAKQFQFVADGKLTASLIEKIEIIHISKKDNGDIHYTLGFFVSAAGTVNQVEVISQQFTRDVSDIDSTTETNVAVGGAATATEFLELRSKSGNNAIFDSISIEFQVAS